MDGYEEITPKEWAISGVVALLALTFAILFYPFVRDAMLLDLNTYQTAAKLTDSQQFSYAKQTNLGNVLGYGNLVADQGVNFPELLQKYGMVSKIQERYTEHSYITCSSTNKDGECTSYTTHYYYTWDYDGEADLSSPTFSFLGVSFPFSQLSISPNEIIPLNKDTFQSSMMANVNDDHLYQSNSFWPSVGDLRWYYEELPLQTTGTLFVQFVDKPTLKQFSYYQNKTIQQVIDDKKQLITTYTILYYVFIVVGITGIFLFLAYEVLDIE